MRLPGVSMNLSIVKKIEEGNAFDEQGKHHEAITVYLSVFNELKEISTSFFQLEETRWVISCIFNSYFSLKEYVTAKQWATDIFKCNIPDNGTSELIDLGSVCFELGENDEAYECFLKAYEKGKYRAFKEYDPKYWEFFKSKHK